MIAIRIVNAILAVWFLFAAVVQLNDPDPIFWVAIYSCVAVIAGLGVFMKFYIPLIVVAFVVCLGGTLYLMPSVFELFLYHDPGDLMTGMSPDRPYVEEARESLGLLIAVVALAYFFLLARKVHKDIAVAGGSGGQTDLNTGL